MMYSKTPWLFLRNEVQVVQKDGINGDLRPLRKSSSGIAILAMNQVLPVNDVLQALHALRRSRSLQYEQYCTRMSETHRKVSVALFMSLNASLRSLNMHDILVAALYRSEIL